MQTDNLIEAIRQWGRDRRLIGPDADVSTSPEAQYDKFYEEVCELGRAIVDGNHEETIDGVGDCAVVLIMISELIGVPFEKCLETAYNVIKDRKGVLRDGKFIKEQ